MATNQKSVKGKKNSSKEENIKDIIGDKWEQISPNFFKLITKTNEFDQYEPKVPRPSNEVKSINPLFNPVTIRNIDNSKPMETIKNNINFGEHANDDEMQKTKTPVTLLNEWAMRKGNGKPEKMVVTYKLVALDGYSHKPSFTFMCLVDNKRVTGTGPSKKEAKQASAARMLEMLKDNSMASSDKIITSTTANDNLDINENDTQNLTNIEGSQQIVDKPDLVKGDINVGHLENNEAVKLSQCEMNPIGALQELSVFYKWSAPTYTYQKQIQNNTTEYQVICSIFNLQTTATSNKRKKAKTMAAHMMFNQINGMSKDILQEFKSSETQITSQDNGCKQNIICMQEGNKKSCAWDAIKIFKLYFKDLVANTMGWSKLCSLLEDDTEQQFKQNEQQFIVQHNSVSSTAVDRLQNLCMELIFETTYVHVNSVLPQKGEGDYSGRTGGHTIILQVNTIPVTVTVGRAETFNMAKEVAAQCVLKTLKTMFLSPSI